MDLRRPLEGVNLALVQSKVLDLMDLRRPLEGVNLELGLFLVSNSLTKKENLKKISVVLILR